MAENGFQMVNNRIKGWRSHRRGVNHRGDRDTERENNGGGNSNEPESMRTAPMEQKFNNKTANKAKEKSDITICIYNIMNAGKNQLEQAL
jgi:hypothetical protein